MTSRYEENELGRNITQQASSGTKRETTVISIRLTTGEIARLEAIGRESGKTVSQIIRDAITVYQVKKPTMVVSMWSGSTITMGEPVEVSDSQYAFDVNYVPAIEGSTGTAWPIQA